MFILILLGLINSQDICKEYLSYESCIKNTHTTCLWDEDRESCFYTSNYLLGCSPYLNKPACLKQLGPSATCRFINRCEYIDDLTSEVCSTPLSKYGCLSIKNPDAICEWNNQCNYVTNISEIQDKFGDKLYSQSACARINHFMIMHNIILWQMTNYEPDLILEADNQYKVEIGLQVNNTKTYNMTGNPQNFFIDTNGQLRLYVLSKTKEVSASDLKISDRTREGCIAIEIQSDKDFLQLLSKNPIYGVNNVFCQQLYETSLKITTAFYQNKCIDIDINNIPAIPCQSLSYRLCGYYYNKNMPCQIVYKTEELYQSEITCIDASKDIVQSTNCEQKLSTFNDCRYADVCYLDFSGVEPQCNYQCFGYYDYKTCKSPCIWEDLTYLASKRSEGDQIQSDGDFQGQAKLCVPPLKCDQPGLTKSMCKKLPYACRWDDDYKLCESIPKIKLKYMKCVEANIMFTCTMIETSNQACLWDGDQCVNVYEISILDQLSTNSMRDKMNLNLCKRSKNYFKYNWALRICDSSRPSALVYESNKIVCFQDANAPNYYWDDFSESCLSQAQYPKQSLNCLSLKQVNFQFCILFGIASSSDNLCLYDPSIRSCYEIQRSEITCQTPGIDANMCLSNNYYCQINNITGNCQIISKNELNQYNCKDLTKVTRLVCVSFIGRLEEPCFYDTMQKSCYVDNVPKNYCNDKMNAYACQTASIKCYFKDLKCQALQSTDYLDWGCNENFMSKSLCLSLDKPCQWNNNKCQDVDKVLSQCEQYQDQTTTKGCAALKTFDSKLLETFNYCQVNDQNVCVQNIETISDCGTNLIINQHRCVGFTQDYCYFDNFVCKQLDFTQRINQIILSNLNCNQANLKTCTKITKVGQNCLVVDDDLSLYIKNKRCVNYDQQQSCASLSSLRINQNVCINSNQACIFQDDLCQDIDNNQKYGCNSKISQTACQQNTIGLCVFDGQCKIFDQKQHECTQLNESACKQSITNQCVFRDGTCQSTYDPTCNFNQNTDSEYYSWTRCSTHYDYCYGYRDICSSDKIDDLPCQIKGSSQWACNSSKQACLNLKGKCFDYFEMKCEEAQTLDECVNIQTVGQNCIFNQLQNLCFNQDNSIPCSAYKVTNLNYCLQYPNCVYRKYSDNYCQDQSIFIQYNVVAAQSKCDIYTVYLEDCVQQFTDTCVYNYDWWACDYYSDFSHCPEITQDIYSKQVCLLAGCKFQITQNGGFCYEGTLTCELLSPFLCIKTIDFNLKCAVVNDLCQDWTETECDSITQMNYFACQLSETCAYDFQNNLCKPKIHKTQDCAVYTNEISCLLTAQNKCKYESDQCVPQDIYASNINRYGCINLDGYYFYDEDLLECVEITDPQFGCHDLTQQACLKLTKDIQCIWQDKCLQISNINLQQISSCELLNKDSCQQIENSSIICKWDNQQCLQETVANDDCTSITLIDNYSRSVCSIALNKCIYNFSECQVIQEQQFNQCEGLGLSKQACLENTSLTYCKWVGYCITANLYSTKCDEVVSQKTCQNIQTLGQYCQYDTQCTNKDVKTFTQCSQAYDLRQCINIDNLSCYYDNDFKECRKTVKEASTCDNNLSKFACFYVNQDTCNWNISCQSINYRTCEDILNRWGCKNTGNPLYCVWQDDKCKSYTIERVPCKDIQPGLNSLACEYTPTDVCEYHTDTLECNADFSYNYLIWTNYPFHNYWPPEYQESYIFGNCEQQMTLEYCKKTRKFSCIWDGNKCIPLTNFKIDCANPISEYACLLSLNQPCAWRYETCIEFTQFEVSLKHSKNTGVNALGCSLFPLQLGFINNVCQEIDSEDVSCYTPGINKLTCLTSLKEQCQYTSTCQKFVKTTQKKCEDYVDVSILVCQQVQDEICFHDGISKCISSILIDNVNLKYLSYYGCLIVKQKVYWDNECKLLDFPIKCDQNIKVNHLVCQDIKGVPCIYDDQLQQCVSYYNKNTLSCKQLGINQEACSLITLDPCRYDNGCQLIKVFDLPCSSYKNVNRLTCALNQYEICHFDSVNQVCQPSLTKQKCSKLGLNKIGCQFNSQCSWSYDYNECQCGSESSLCGQDCFSNANCVQNQFGCRKLLCEELSIQNCFGQVKNQYCIIIQDKCRGVSQCEDIKNYDKCDKLFVANKNCIQAGNNCISSTNYEQLCPYSDCTHFKCFNDKNLCRLKLCTDLNVKNCNELPECQIINNQCVQVDNCIDSDCQNLNCSYQKYALLKSQQICTTQFCDFYGGSQNLCHGNESNNRACILTSEYLCRSCEQIQDQCECQSAKNICYYDQGCKSILCGQFLSQETCLATNRCQWSLALSQCTVTCIQTVDQDRCNARTNECYFNTLTYICEEGQLQVPDLSPGFDVQIVTYQIILQIMIYILY